MDSNKGFISPSCNESKILLISVYLQFMVGFWEWVQPFQRHFVDLFNCAHSRLPNLMLWLKMILWFCHPFWWFLTIPSIFHIWVLLKEQSIYSCHHLIQRIQYQTSIWINDDILMKETKVIYEIFFVKIEGLL